MGIILLRAHTMQVITQKLLAVSLIFRYSDIIFLLKRQQEQEDFVKQCLGYLCHLVVGSFEASAA